jgi:hypothetical protein
VRGSIPTSPLAGPTRARARGANSRVVDKEDFDSFEPLDCLVPASPASTCASPVSPGLSCPSLSTAPSLCLLLSRSDPSAGRRRVHSGCECEITVLIDVPSDMVLHTTFDSFGLSF